MIGILITSILHMRELRFIELKELAQDHTVSKRETKMQTKVCLIPRTHALNTVLPHH